VFKDELLENRYCLQILFIADSEREFEYKEKVLKEILEETGAKDFMPAIVNVQLMELMCVTLITQYVNSLIFRPSFGEFLTSYGQYVTWDDDMRAAKSCNEVRSKYVEEGKFVDDGFENMWGGPEEQYTYGHFEGLFCPDPADVASMKARDEYVGETHEEILRQKLMGTLTIPLGGSPQILAPKDLGQKLSNYMRWSKAIKESFDPDNLAEGMAYLNLEDIPESILETFKSAREGKHMKL
jgi:hypothetical protein